MPLRRWFARPLDAQSGLDGVCTRRKHDHEPVALGLDDVAAAAVDVSADLRVVHDQQSDPGVVAELSVQRGRSLDVGEEDGHGAVFGSHPGDLVAVLHRGTRQLVDRLQHQPTKALFTHLDGGLHNSLDRPLRAERRPA